MEEELMQYDTKYGIHRVFRFAKKKNKTYTTIKKDIIALESKTKATVVKIEFTLNTCIVLLSDGRVLTKGKDDYTIGRNTDGESGKKFGEVEFNSNDLEDNQTIIIYNISAGEDHVLALDKSYNVYGWGKNDLKQIVPKSNITEYKKPEKIPIPNEARVLQVFALCKSSMIICKQNMIWMWGSCHEGFLGNFKDRINAGTNFKMTEFLKMDKITDYIETDIRKNDISYTEAFINSRKLFNTKYNQTLEENLTKNSRIDKLNNQINALKQEIDKRNKNNSEMIQKLSIRSSDKRITVLQDLLKEYEEKLNKISLKKDTLRKELINIESEINHKDIDLSK